LLPGPIDRDLIDPDQLAHSQCEEPPHLSLSAAAPIQG
jgi:hypothetical protein